MNTDFPSTNSKQGNNYYKYNQQQSGYGGQQQFSNQMQGYGNAYNGYMDQYNQQGFYNPYQYQSGMGQNYYPYNMSYNYQQGQTQGQNFDTAQYQQMLLQSQQYGQGTNQTAQTGDVNQIDFNQMNSNLMSAYGYDPNMGLNNFQQGDLQNNSEFDKQIDKW